MRKELKAQSPAIKKYGLLDNPEITKYGPYIAESEAEWEWIQIDLLHEKPVLMHHRNTTTTVKAPISWKIDAMEYHVGLGKT